MKITKVRNGKKGVRKKTSTVKPLPSIFGTTLTRGYLKSNPVTKTIIAYLCEKLVDYSCEPSATFIGVFTKNMRIPRRTFYNWLKKYPELAEAYEEAKENIGVNRMDGAINRRFDRLSILHSQYRYGEEWKEDDIHQANIKNLDDKQTGTVNVYITPDERVAEVKDRVVEQHLEKRNTL